MTARPRAIVGVVAVALVIAFASAAPTGREDFAVDHAGVQVDSVDCKPVSFVLVGATGSLAKKYLWQVCLSGLCVPAAMPLIDA